MRAQVTELCAAMDESVTRADSTEAPLPMDEPLAMDRTRRAPAPTTALSTTAWHSQAPSATVEAPRICTPGPITAVLATVAWSSMVVSPRVGESSSVVTPRVRGSGSISHTVRVSSHTCSSMASAAMSVSTRGSTGTQPSPSPRQATGSPPENSQRPDSRWAPSTRRASSSHPFQPLGGRA